MQETTIKIITWFDKKKAIYKGINFIVNFSNIIMYMLNNLTK
jgi:hypothetical protein